MENNEGKVLGEIRLLRDEMSSLKGEMSSLKSEMNSGFDQVNGRLDKVENKLEDTYKLAQRANVLNEDLDHKVQQIAEGVVDAMLLKSTIAGHEDRIRDLEWRVDMHDKCLKKTA